MNAFRCYLANSLESSGYNAGQISAITAKYDRAASVSNPERAFREVLDAYGSCDIDKAVATVAGDIQRALEQANRQTVDTNPVTRMREKIESFKKHVAKIDFEVCGVDETQLADHQKDGIRECREQRRKVANPVVPKLAFTPEGYLVKPFFYSATANQRNHTFDVEWTL